ncbi:MAG TPA: ATP-binding protein [Flavisolibacter sp.]|nr:ATP-binding protein [Flavisolibacter sp.]
MNTISKQDKRFPFLHNSGEMGALILQQDWSVSAIGTIDQWPPALRTTLGIMLHSAFPMFLFWGPELTCFYNDAFRPSLGIDGKHPAIGKHGKEVWADVWDFIGPLIQQVINTGLPVYFENQLVPFYRNGRMEDIYWTFSYSPVYDDNGRINGVFVTCAETTQHVQDRKKIEDIVLQRTRQLEETHEALLQSNNYLQQLINLSREPLQVLEPIIEDNKVIDFRFRLTNQAYANYANTSPGALQGRKVGEVFPGYFETSSFVNVAKAFETGKPDTWEIHYNTDGLDLYNEMNAVKLGDQVVVHFTDFTRLKHLQLELLYKIKELERSNEQLEEFAHVASHDLKEPIRKVQFFITRLKKELLPRLNEGEQDLFTRIESANLRMGMLIDDLLTYSQLRTLPGEKETVDLDALVRQILEDLALNVQEKNASVNLVSLPTIQGYRRQLQQLFQNLLSNALKYCNDGQPVQIEVSGNRIKENGMEYYQVQVKDNGIGFEQQYAETIFQLFTRLHGKQEYAGTGIGLSIVKKVVENHQGKIRAESKPGEGSVFTVLFPVEEALKEGKNQK